MKEALLYEKTEDDKVRCHLCAHRCIINDGGTGICQVRHNEGGTLYTDTYGTLIARHVDPIEKKPLYHVLPGSRSYSIATPGCNFRCHWCQNADISQIPRDHPFPAFEASTPASVVTEAQRTRCASIAYTYTEPTIFFEFALDTARLAHSAGILNVYVSNGFMTPEMLDTFHPYLDAVNVDLKAFREETYRKYTGARLQPVLDTLKKLKEKGIWLEITTLIIPGISDSEEDLRGVAHFISTELDPATPWHLSRFFPSYKIDHTAATPVATLRRARDIGREEGLKHIYVGNVPDTASEQTQCAQCGATVIEGRRYGTLRAHLDHGHCPKCGHKLEGIFGDLEAFIKAKHGQAE